MPFNTVKHVSYAGITLPLATPQLAAWLASVHPQDFADFEPWNFDQPNTESLPTPPIPTPPDFNVGVLTWPTGACRPAWFHAVVTTAILNQIKAVEGSTASLQNLVLYDGRSGKTITARMFRLPERNIAELGHTDSDSWIVTFTDVRFYWHWRRDVIAQPQSWTELFSRLGAILGVTITVDSIPSVYQQPSTKWALPYPPTPVVLDAAAAQVGQRVVVGLDGSVRTRRWENARDESNTYIAGNPHVLSGSVTPTTGIARYVPASIRTLFPDTTVTPFQSAPIVVSNTLVSLAIPDYGAATGVANYYQTLFGDIRYDGSNAASLVAYAAQFAGDWYGWRLADADIVWPGIEPWTPTGWEDEIRWTVQVRGDGPFASTMVRRGVWNDFQSGDWYAGLAPIPDWFPGSGSGSGSGSGPCIRPVTVACTVGNRVLSSKSIRVGVQNNQIKLIECDTEDYPLGPCSPVNPNGLPINLVNKVCPVFTTLQYLDWDAEPQEIRVVTGITVERTLVVVPIGDAQGCIEDQDTCCGSGSGSGPDCGDGLCVTLCDQCPGGISLQWELDIGQEQTATLQYVCDPNDGVSCRFVSEDLVWDLRYDSDSGLWVLTNLDDPIANRRIWFVDGAAWNCNDSNTMTAFDEGQDDALLTPQNRCDAIRYDCIDGYCQDTPNGQYSTREECLAACGIVTTCCPIDLVQSRLTATISGAGGGLDGTYTLTNVGAVWDYTTSLAFGSCNPGSPRNVLELTCGGMTWSLGVNSPFPSMYTPSTSVCFPFNLVFLNVDLSGCGGSTTATITVTA